MNSRHRWTCKVTEKGDKGDDWRIKVIALAFPPSFPGVDCDHRQIRYRGRSVVTGRIDPQVPVNIDAALAHEGIDSFSNPCSLVLIQESRQTMGGPK